MPTATPFNNLITFSRGSNATVTGSNGLIKWAPNNVLLQSESLDNASWTKQASTITANNTLAPDGTITADKIVEAATTAAHGVRQSAALSALAATLSFYAKKAEREFVNVWAFGGNIDTTATRAGFNLTTGVATVRPGQTATIQDVGNGWYRCTVSIIITAAGSPTFHIGPNIADLTQDYTGDGTSGVFIWGAQLELGSTATTYNNTSVRNLLGFSEAFDNAAWGTPTGASIVTGAQANPVNGLFNAQKLMENTSTGLHFIAQAAATAAAPYTFSCYAKAAGRNFIFLYNPATNISLSVDLTTGATGQASGTVAPTASSAVSVGNGWYRVSMTLTTTAASNNFRIYLGQSLTGTGSYTGDGNSGVYIYGAQLSDSASLDPYVPTPGAAPSSTAYYGPRFDYDPVTRAPRGLLIEEARTNLMLQSNDFTVGATWQASIGGTSTRTNGSTALGFTQGVITATSANGGVRQQIGSLSSGQVYALSFYIQSTSTAITLLFENGTATFGSPHSVVFNPAIGTFGLLTGFTSGSVTRFGSGYIYTFITAPAGGTLLANIEWRIPNSGDVINFGRPQFEAGAFATSYIPTVASTVTRAADIATITGSLFSQWYGQTEGSFVAIFTAAQNTFTTYLAASNGVVAQNSMHMDNDGSGNMRVAYYSGSSAQALLSLGTVGTIGAVNRVSTAYRANDFAASRNGGTVVSDTAGAVPVGVNRLNIGADPSGAAVNVSNGHIRYAAYYPVRLADFQLQALTELPLVPTLDADFINNLYEA